MEYIKLPVSQRLNIQAFSNMLDWECQLKFDPFGT
jgi:hypothetical protein